MRRSRRMTIELHPDKNATNIRKHGRPLMQFLALDFDAAILWPDDRKDYGEVRWLMAAPLSVRLHMACFGLTTWGGCEFLAEVACPGSGAPSSRAGTWAGLPGGSDRGRRINRSPTLPERSFLVR